MGSITSAGAAASSSGIYADCATKGEDSMAVFVTGKASPRHHNMSIDDLWFGDDNVQSWIQPNTTNTVTRLTNNKPYVDTRTLIRVISDFCSKHTHLITADKQTLYRTFYVPKSSGGLRRIDAPNEELSNALRDLIYIFKIGRAHV